MRNHLALVALLGCGATEQRPAGDAREVDVDGASADAPASSGDGGTGLTTTEFQCVTSTRIFTRADSSRSESRTHFLLIDGVSDVDDFRVGLCDQVTTQFPPATCPVGTVCTESGPPVPPTKCSWNRGGSFTEDGRLLVICGSGNSSFDSNGNLLNSFDSRASRVLLRR